MKIAAPYCHDTPFRLSSQVFGQFRSRHVDLLAACQIFHRKLIGRHFVFADDDDVLRARFLAPVRTTSSAGNSHRRGRH